MSRRAPSPPRLPLNVLLGRTRLRKRFIALATFLILLAFWYADRQGMLLPGGGDWARYQQKTALVTHIVDGDTIDVDIPDQDKPTTRIRLWGVNSPEIDHPEFGKTGQPFGSEATSFTKKLADHQHITLELQQHQLRDRYGRLLAYIKLPDGTYLNEQLLIAGLARADRRPNNPSFTHQWLDRYDLLQQQARQQHLGMWSLPAVTATAPALEDGD